MNWTESQTLSYATLQQQNISVTLFGALATWGFLVTIEAVLLWRKERGKQMVMLNAWQTALNLIKITASMIFNNFYGLSCAVRPFIINLPQQLCWLCIYLMLLKKLLLFTKHKKLCIGFYALCLSVHFCLVLAGVLLSTSSQKDGKCRNTYPLLFKQQYSVEIALEVFTFLMLLRALTIPQTTLFATTKALFKQLKDNEQLRMFWVCLFITVKIILTYNPITAFDALVLTHAIDSARSALVHYVLIDEQRKLRKAVMNARPSLNIKETASHGHSSSGIKESSLTVRESTSNLRRASLPQTSSPPRHQHHVSILHEDEQFVLKD